MFNFALRRLATILAVTTLTLSLIAALTGTLLAFYYGPGANEAYDSLQQILHQVPSGWLVQSLHSISGNGLIAVSLVQIVVMFLGRQFRLSWLTAWISGLLLTLSAIALAWTAMNLDWTQVGYWRLNLELGTIEAIPLVGPQLRQILTGGGAISTVTIKHLYALHSYVLSSGAIALSILHLIGLLIQEQEQKLEAVRINAQPQELAQQEPALPHQHDQQKFNPDNPLSIA